MANQFQRGTNIGTTVESAAQLHALVEGAKILPGAITDQIQADSLGASDFVLVYHSASNGLRKVQIGSLVFTPGDILPTAAANVSGAWLLCDGAQYAQNEYASLYAVIGSAFGAADAGYFRVPDLRGRVPAGRDTLMGGAYAGRLTSAGAGNPELDSKVLGAANGAEKVILSAAQLPAHSHPISWPSATEYAYAFHKEEDAQLGGSAQRVSNVSLYPLPTATSNSTGGGVAHPNVQPTIVLNFKIKT